MSIPEPPPKNEGECVPEFIFKWAEQMLDPAYRQILIQLIRERDEFGFKKYGQRLMTKDGRNSIEDARQELGDAIQYIVKAKLNGEDVRSLFPLILLLDVIVHNDLSVIQG